MAKKLTSTLGVDIGSRSIKVAEIKPGGVISAVGMIDTPEGSVDHTGIYNPDAVGQALKTLLAQIGASVPHAIVSLQGQQSVLVRTIEVPRQTAQELANHMEWELNRNNPFAEANPIKDFKALPDENPSSQNMDVVMAIASPMAVDTVVSCIKKAGKQPAAIDVEPLAIARCLSTGYADSYRGQTVCVVNIGHKSTSINIYRDGKLLMPRQVPVGGENFSKAIADRMGISVAEAEQVKFDQVDCNSVSTAAPANPFAAGVTQGFTPYNPFSDDPGPAPEDQPPVQSGAADNDVANDAVAVELDEFVAEIRRSIDYFRSRGSDVGRLVVCGGGAKMKGMSEFLGKSLGMPCDRFNPFERLNLSAKKVEDAYLEEHKEEFVVAVGNALYIQFD